MTIQVDQTLVKAVEAANAPMWVMGLQDVSIVSLALLIIVVVGGWMFKRFRADGKVEDAKGELYGGMSERIQKLEALLEKVSVERDAFLRANANLEGRLTVLENIEKRHDQLLEKLDRKDDQISDLEIAVEHLKEENNELRRQMSVLQLQYAEKCDACENRRRS